MTQLLQGFVTLQAEREPTASALVLDQQTLSYGELEERSNQLARLLRTSGVIKGDRICILVPKSPAAIVAILGTLKADCVYVPLDIGSPAQRLAKMVESCEPRWILATESTRPLLDELLMIEKFKKAILVGSVERNALEGENFKSDFSENDLESVSNAHLDYRQTPEDAAYIMFTSGSTGTPKGVVITHANVFHFVTWANHYFETRPTDRNSGFFPLHFDLSVYDVFGTVAAGAQLRLVPAEVNLLPNKVADFIRSAKLTQWFSVPSLLNYMSKLDVVRFDDFPSLKRVIWCGEVLPTPSLVYWMKRLPGVSFTNLYGPTEATIASSYYTVPSCPEDETAAVPIGTACEGEELLVLNDKLQPVPRGEIGDLYIKGVGLSPGYWRDPERTREVFRPDPRSTHPEARIYKTGDLAAGGADGLIYFHGRADFQIKSRGYRIELGEIVSALTALGCLKECAVVDIDVGGFEGATICCAYVLQPESRAAAVTLRRMLTEVLPGYMLPSRWMAVEALPRNANGKVDHGQLREQFRNQ
jgi:amino acid adenylation domain-containing protein